MALEPKPVFLHRPDAEPAVPIGGGAARPELATRAVLQTVDGGVLVKSIRRQPDGAFEGEVYGVTPRQRSVVVGDLVRFAESQIFTFKVADAEKDAAAAEMAEMIRTFEAHLGQREAHPMQDTAARPRPATDFSRDVAADTIEGTAGTRAAAVQPETDRAPPAMPAEADAELSLAEALSILGASEQHERTPQAARVESVPVDDVKSAAARGADEHPIACLECGAPLSVAPPAGGPPQTSGISRVACRNCGRINDIAEAEAASRRRQALRNELPMSE